MTTSGETTSGETTSSRTTTRQATSRQATSRQATSGETTSGRPGRTASGRTARPAEGVGRVRVALCAVAVLACVPYLLLKAAWLSGSRVGIPEGSVLTDGTTTLHVLNAVTLALDVCVVVLALALVLPFGQRLPGWLLLVPLWAATGLLTPLVLVVPLVTVLGGLTPGPATGEQAAPPFLDSWVAPVVYGGFTVQALALGALFVPYFRQRWGHLLRGRVADLPAAPAGRLISGSAVVAVVAAATAGVLHLWWALAGRSGLVLRMMEGVHAAAAAGAVLAVLWLVFRRRPGTRLAVALTTGWAGGAVLAAWGLWWFVMSVSGVFHTGADEHTSTPAEWLAYSAQVISGLLLLGMGLSLSRLLSRPGRPRTVSSSGGTRG
ncbi:hypothetical protein GL263_00685 [Streptomyces durbertensis]|uniref:LigA protein n=1 Tax=Streptomyces durbertensis TaxID=2448886 RepID=A0ABR6EAU6_9ACTN|nr:hypothetical protein [Streptomyces durbertensis]MBB1242100.1 hypothetical protein [Streptomyces durbertensis]